jgi:UDPglucose 6-dehydrogenase
MRNISVVGLGRLGAPIAACFASRGNYVIGVDVNPETVRLVNEGHSPVFEPGLGELLCANRERIVATDDHQEAIQRSEITFVVVPTPSDDQGGFSLRHVLRACERIGEALREKVDYHLVVLTSTVLPGATDSEVKPMLEERSGKRCGPDFGLCFSPEFIALGTVIRDLLNPDFVLIGESDIRSGDMLAGIYQNLCHNDPPVARMNVVNAELTKLAINTFVTTKISYANMLAQVCERIPGADVDVVTSALGLDSRIGRKYLKGAIGYGGPCFPRDNLAFAYLTRKLGTHAILAEATDQVNRQQAPRLAELVLSRLATGGRVGILGVSYKNNSDVVERSQGLELARHLLAHGISVVLYDPVAMHNARLALEGDVVFASSVKECTGQANVVVVTTPWEEFRELSPVHLNYSNGRPTLVDCWRILDRKRFERVADYIVLGTGPCRDGHVKNVPVRVS